MIDRLRTHPVARALRLDKMTLAALEATLRLYQDPQKARREIPTLRFLTRTPAETAALAANVQAAIERLCTNGFILEVEESSARTGGGSMPLAELPSHAVRIRFPEPPVESGARDVEAARSTTPTVSALEAALRHAPIPVVARVSQDSVHLDVVALDERDVEAVAESAAWAIERVVAAAGARRPAPNR